MPKFKTIQKLIDKLNLVTRENLSGMFVIRPLIIRRLRKKDLIKLTGEQ